MDRARTADWQTQPAPVYPGVNLAVRMVAPVLRGGFVREHLVVGHVVMVHVIARRPVDNGWPDAQIADHGAVTAMSTTSSPNRRPLGQPPGTTPPPKPVCTLLTSVSPPKMPSREKPGSSGLVGLVAPPPARRALAVERSTLIRSGMKMPAMSVR